MHQKKLFSFDMIKNIRNNYSLLPVTLLAGLGLSGAIFTFLRSLSRHPDISVNRRNNPRPYEKYDHKPYRFFKQTLHQKDPDRPALFDEK